MTSEEPSEGIFAVYGDVEKEGEQILKVNRMLIVRDKKPPLVLLGPPAKFAVNPDDEMQVKRLLALTASQGVDEVLMRIHTDVVFVKNAREFDDVLRRFVGARKPE